MKIEVCNVNKKNELIISALKSIMKKYRIKSEELGEKREDQNNRIVFSLSSYLKNLQKFGAKFGSTESTIEKLLTATAVYALSDVEMSKIVGVSRRRIADAKQRRLVFDDIVDKEERNNEDSSDESNDDISYARSENAQNEEENESDYFSEKEIENEKEIVDNVVVEEKKMKRKNVFEIALTPKPHEKRKDKLNLEIVRDFCHENCRLGTFSITRILVRNYDDSLTYHDLHIRSKSLKEHHSMFENSYEYSNWKNKNRRKNTDSCDENEVYKYPTIGFRSFTNAFCPCCLDQKQRDCANYVQVNFINAFKALGNLRKHHNVSNAIKECDCSGHRNESYLQCHTSLRKFTNAILCPV